MCALTMLRDRLALWLSSSEALTIPRSSSDGGATSATTLPDRDRSDTEKKIELLTKSYDEVLDATKHQDDKIGRLLTVVAFLTAGTLAIGALGQGALLARRYNLPPFSLPLGLIALVLFLMGVFVTVVLLLMALSHPLRIPGLGARRQDDAAEKDREAQVRDTSQLYFYPISGVTKLEWETKWVGDAVQLQEARLEDLIAETHNLSGRTKFKYERGREAVAIFTLTLLFFALAATFQSFSAVAPPAPNTPITPLTLVWYHKLILATVVSTYLALVIAGPNRASRQSFEDTLVRKNPPLRVRINAERTYAFLLPLGVFNLLNYLPFWYPVGAWQVAVIAISFLSLVAFFCASHPGRGSNRRNRDRWAIGRVAFATTGLTTWAVFASIYDSYWSIVVVAALVPTIICVASTVQPILQSRRQRKRYEDSIGT